MNKMAIALAIGIPISICEVECVDELTEELKRNTRSKFKKVILDIGGLGICVGMAYATGGFIVGLINLIAKN